MDENTQFATACERYMNLSGWKQYDEWRTIIEPAWREVKAALVPLTLTRNLFTDEAKVILNRVIAHRREHIDRRYQEMRRG